MRLSIAILLGAAIVVPYYAVEIHRGYLAQGFGYFPLLVGFTDLPHCPACDYIHLRFPLFELAAVSALVFGVLSLPLLWKRKSNYPRNGVNRAL
jgi:hypothetical protein